MEKQGKEKLSATLSTTLESEFSCYRDNFLLELANAKKAGVSPAHQSHVLLEADLPQPSCQLGSILIEELRHPLISDIFLKVEDEVFLCHRNVLISRCAYFSAMLQNQWSESNCANITLENMKASSFAAMLSFIYGASPEFPQFCSLPDALQIADMLGITGFMSVAKHHMRFQLCHSFHKPCQDCAVNMPDVIQLCFRFSLSDLYAACLKWNVKYFQKLWPTRNFASLPQSLQENCRKAIVSSMSITNVIHILMDTDKLLSGVTRVQWTKPLVKVATELMTSCCDFIASHFYDVTANNAIVVLFQGMGWKADVVERILVQIAKRLAVENVCNVHIAVCVLVHMAQKENWNKEFVEMLGELKTKVWSHLVSNYYAVIHTESWHHMSSSDKMSLKSETLCQGDETRKLARKPVLSSSLQRTTKKTSEVKPKIKTRQMKPSEVTLEQHKKSNYCDEKPPPLKNIVCIQEIKVGRWFTD